MSLIEIKNVSLELSKTKILDDINIEIDGPGIYGLIGRNGSGKTMLMKCICGFVRPGCGSVMVDGKQVGKDMDFPESMGVIIETPGFIPYFSGFRNLKLLAKLAGRIDDEAVRSAMQCVGLDPNLKRHVGKYSLGMRQRLGLAQAIMEDTDLLVLDEPFNGPDIDGVEDMRRYLLELRDKGKTIIISSHNREDIDILCDMTWRLEKGRLVK